MRLVAWTVAHTSPGWGIQCKNRESEIMSKSNSLLFIEDLEFVGAASSCPMSTETTQWICVCVCSFGGPLVYQYIFRCYTKGSHFSGTFTLQHLLFAIVPLNSVQFSSDSMFPLFLIMHFFAVLSTPSPGIFHVCAVTVIQGIILSLIEITLINNCSKTMHF